MNAPSPEEIRLDAGLPENANFHGWLIHNPEKDDFLLKAMDKGATSNFAWCRSPESAKRYNRFSRAYKAFNNFELQDRAIIVASFDIGRQIIVIAPKRFNERFMSSSNNPFRTLDVTL